MTADEARPPLVREGRPYWERGWFWLLLALVSALPFVVAPLPVMPDHFAHVARYHVMLTHADSAFLQRYFSLEWRLIGNLGVDGLVLVLGRFMPVEAAATLAVALVPVLTVAGIHALAKAAHGRVPATALLALMMVWTFTFSYGFENYHLSLALALLVAALWVRLAEADQRWRALAMAPLSLLVWLAHVSGWGVMGLVILGWEWARARGKTPDAGLAVRLGRIMLRMLPLAAPFALFVFWTPSAMSDLSMAGPLYKMFFVWDMFRAELIWLDRLLVVAMAMLVTALLVRLWPRRNPGMFAAAVLLLVAFLFMPRAVLGSYFADQRLLPAFGIMLVLALPAPGRRAAMRLAVVALALFGVRMAEMSLGWWQRGRLLQAELVAMDHVPRGARVAAMARMSGCAGGVLSGHDHLADYVITRRDGFANTQWDVAGAQLVRPIYNRGRGYNHDGSVFIGDSRYPRCYGRPLDEMVDGLPRDRFDFVWTFDAPVVRPWLEPVFKGPHGRLYRVLAPPAGPNTR